MCLSTWEELQHQHLVYSSKNTFMQNLFKELNMSTSCHWLVLPVHVKWSRVDLQQIVKFGHNDKKNDRQVQLCFLHLYQRTTENNWIIHKFKVTTSAHTHLAETYLTEKIIVTSKYVILMSWNNVISVDCKYSLFAFMSWC